MSSVNIIIRLIVSCRHRRVEMSMSTLLFLLFLLVQFSDPLPVSSSFSAKHLSQAGEQINNTSARQLPLSGQASQILRSSQIKPGKQDLNHYLRTTQKSDTQKPSILQSTSFPPFHVHSSKESMPRAIDKLKRNRNLARGFVSTSSSNSTSKEYLLQPPTTNKPNASSSSGRFEGLDEERDATTLVLKLNRNYTPSEIAEYIFSTGDEKGVSQTIWEMVQDGQFMASRDDLILFLERVQLELELMRRHQKVE